MTDREIMQQALEALVLAQKDAQIAEADYAITALRERLAQPEQSRAEKMRDAGYTRRPTLREIAREDEQPEQEPVGEVVSIEFHEEFGAEATVSLHQDVELGAKLYTTPPRREWVSLTDEEIAEAGKLWVEGERMLPFAFASAIEAKLREKNHD